MAARSSVSSETGSISDTVQGTSASSGSEQTAVGQDAEPEASKRAEISNKLDSDDDSDSSDLSDFTDESDEEKDLEILRTAMLQRRKQAKRAARGRCQARSFRQQPRRVFAYGYHGITLTSAHLTTLRENKSVSDGTYTNHLNHDLSLSFFHYFSLFFCCKI